VTRVTPREHINLHPSSCSHALLQIRLLLA
jgi:hypothetical protein